jgi:hypothetical protein
LDNPALIFLLDLVEHSLFDIDVASSVDIARKRTWACLRRHEMTAWIDTPPTI